MKKILVAFALAAVASTASALVENGPHDVRGYNGSTTTLGVCQYCHAPHLWSGASNLGTVAPLWNRNQNGAITAYTSATLKGTATPGANSRTCLTCHDGVTNLGAVNNGTVDSIGAITAAIVGLDLGNDHPVGRPQPASDTTFVAPTTIPTTGSVKLYTASYNVECASCHEPHDNTNGSFLRLSQAALCGACHIK